MVARAKWEGHSFTGAPGECGDPYFDLCFRNVDPLDEEFQQTARAVFEPLLTRADGGGGMKSVPVFQLAETELRTGTSLVEASAGTGKTYTIAGLFLRLILEKNLSVREILVVTYTVAATEELRHRIRSTLAKALQAFTTGASDDAFLRALLTRHADQRADLAGAAGPRALRL